ncbi:MAG TPA: YkvA family protein [Lachnospiraceae bacterium]|nr:YkvA family protein [Lachnospiraceae bacterium]
MNYHKTGLKERAKKLKSDIPAVFLCLKSKDTPVGAKIMAGITIGYALSPIDFIPDFIPVLGYLDDIILLPILVALTVKLIPDEILSRCKLEAEGLWKDGKPKKWYYAIPIIVFWFIILWLILKML